ncbi:hypothetical protein ACU8KH_05222 [Lachancea thermotolerans]
MSLTTNLNSVSSSELLASSPAIASLSNPSAQSLMREELPGMIVGGELHPDEHLKAIIPTQKDSSENKDNWIQKGLAWDPQCVIA